MDKPVAKSPFNRPAKTQTFAHLISPALRGLDGDMDAAIETFVNWRGQSVDIPKTVEKIAKDLGFSARDRRMLAAAAKLAAEPAANPYHGNAHFLEVFYMAALLGNDARRNDRLDNTGLRNLMAAALIHDYRHDGTNNRGQRFRLEREAFEGAQTPLRKAGFTETDLRHIRAFVYTTDVSRDFSDPTAKSAADTVKAYVASGGKAKLWPELRPLKSLRLADTALMLQDADIAASVIDFGLTGQNSALLAKEQGAPCRPQSLHFFFNTICRHQVYSISGFGLIQPLMDRTMKQFGVTPTSEIYVPRVSKPKGQTLC